MKTRFTLLLSLLVVFQVALAEVHITEADPTNWSTQIFSPYIGQTVVFDIPIVVSTVSGTTYIRLHKKKSYFSLRAEQSFAGKN